MGMNEAEKRKHQRVTVRTSALLFDRRRESGQWDAPRYPLGRFNVVNVSMGGALIDGDIKLPVGTPVGVHLQLPGTQVQMGSVVVRTERADDSSPTSPPLARNLFALSFEVVPARDEDAVKRALDAVIEHRRNRPSGAYPRTRTEPEVHLMTPSGAAWHTLRELEAVHAQECRRCQHPFANQSPAIGEPCLHGQDLRSLLRAMTLVLADPGQYPRNLLDCRDLVLGWLGRDLDGKTREVLRFRMDEPSVLALAGRGAMDRRPGARRM
jgi:hypothetical protein